MPTSFPIPSSSTQALFPLTNWLNQWLNRFLDGSQFLLFPGVEDNKMTGISNDVLSAILDKMHLGHLIENFQREKVTVDQIRVLASVALLYIPRAFWVALYLELFVTSTSWAPFLPNLVFEHFPGKSNLARCITVHQARTRSLLSRFWRNVRGFNRAFNVNYKDQVSLTAFFEAFPKGWLWKMSGRSRKSH